MAQRSSRAGPIALLAAANRASLTAATRTSRLMPFSRSQNSRTAKKSAFISLKFPYMGNKKVGRIISDFVALENQQTLPFSDKDRELCQESQDANRMHRLALTGWMGSMILRQ